MNHTYRRVIELFLDRNPERQLMLRFFHLGVEVRERSERISYNGIEIFVADRAVGYIKAPLLEIESHNSLTVTALDGSHT